MMDIQPSGLRKLTKEVYEEEYFVGDRSPIIFGYASIFYRANAWYRFQKVAALIKRHGGRGRALDVGCALGHSVKRFRKIGLKPVGCDVSAWATRKAKEMNPHTGIVRGDALFLPFKSKMFDVTTAFETLEHCSDLDWALNEVKRVTKPHGLVVVSVPTTDLNATYEDRSHVWHMSLKEWLDLFRDYFKVLSVNYFMKFMKYVDGKTCNTFIALRNKNG